ncbi:MAG: class I SAM-dependent methyltransferase [Candidatus Latescibacterota bacterium]
MSSRICSPYQGLAGIYDYVMRHVDYGDWAAYIGGLLDRYEHCPTSLADLACGTGNITFELRRLGYPVALGVDASEAMLRVAREKAVTAGLEIDFLRRDLQDLGGLGTFGAAVCIYDSANYLLSLDDVRLALQQVYAVLQDGGLFIFDVCTEQNSLRYFRQVHDEEVGPGFSYTRHSFYDASDRLQVNDFAIRFDGLPEVVEEHHVQRIHAVADLLEVTASGPFELLGAFDGFTFRRGSEQSDRVHFVLRRPGA